MPYQTGRTGTSFTDTSISPGTAYYYQLTAVNGSVQTSASAEASASTSAAGPTVATAAAATLSSDGTSAALSILGADQGGEAGLTYT